MTRANGHAQVSFAKAEITHLRGNVSVTGEDINKNDAIFQLTDALRPPYKSKWTLNGAPKKI